MLDIRPPELPARFVRRERPEISAPLVVIACCAGYGKSSYLTQLAAEEPESVLISFGEYDDSAERVASVIGALVSDTSGLPVQGGGYDAVCRFIGEMSACENGYVLIDNADVVTDRTASALISLLCKAAAQGCFRLLLAGRDIPSCALEPVMNGEAALYGIKEMRFTKAETGEYLRRSGKAYTDKYLNALYSYTAGWCAGVAEISKAARGDYDIEKCADRTLLSRYARQNILTPAGSDLSEYLELTAFVSPPGGDFCSDVFCISDGEARADRLVTGGFLERGGSGELLYPEVLRTVISCMLPADRKRAILERAAEYYIREKHFAEAIKLFEASGNADAAERILRSYGEKFLANYEFELIGYCGGIIEKRRGTSDPEVLGILAQYHYYCGDLAKMEAALNMADSMFGRENRYSVCRKLYNGLMRYEGNKELYSANVRSACEYLEANGIPLPFLHQKELDTLKLIRAGSDDSVKLHIHRFGSLRLSVDKTEIQCKSRKSAELIAYMLENDGRPVPREELLNMLWSDGIPTNAVPMLHNIIYGLRRELTAYGLENVIIYKNKSYMPDMSLIAEDDSEILAVCDAVESSDRKKLGEHLGVLEKYWGRYLGNSDSRGSGERKEYYDRCFVNASVMAAEICREKGEYERELLYLKNASELDPYSEQIVCSYIMSCFAAGKPDKAKKKYEEYSVMINEELGIAPSKWLRREFLAGFSAAGEGENESV